MQQYVNTFDREAGRDALATADALAGWFRRWTDWPAGATPSRREHRVALTIREGVRELARRPTHDDPELASALDGLDLRLGLRDGALRLHSTNRSGRAVGPVLDAVRAAMDDGSWDRIKTCDRDRCRWLYYDSSRNGSSKWCATAICGSREKARRAYQRSRRAP